MTLPKGAEIGPNAFSGSCIVDTVKIPDGADHQTTVKLAHALRFTFSFFDAAAKALPQEYKDSLFATSVREFKDSHIMELRVPAECRERLEGNIMGWGWPKIEISEMTDPKLGLCAVSRPRKA